MAEHEIAALAAVLLVLIYGRVAGEATVALMSALIVAVLTGSIQATALVVVPLMLAGLLKSVRS